MKKRKILTICIVFFLIFAGWVLYENKNIGITHYEIDCGSRSELSGFTIVQISDLHNEEFGENQKNLLKKTEECNPDMIAITGDFIDCRHPDIEAAMAFVKQAVDIAPIYYVPGNHERWVHEEYKELSEKMMEQGVHLLINSTEYIFYNDESILCIGVEDPDFYNVSDNRKRAEIMSAHIEQLNQADESFSILLSHRPELFPIYKKQQVNLVLTGHAHGGQFRLPILGGLAAPNQGLFPKYDAGIFKAEQTQMIVSRGLGNSIIPLRVNNPPEIVVIRFAEK